MRRTISSASAKWSAFARTAPGEFFAVYLLPVAIVAAVVWLMGREPWRPATDDGPVFEQLSPPIRTDWSTPHGR